MNTRNLRTTTFVAGTVVYLAGCGGGESEVQAADSESRSPRPSRP